MFYENCTEEELLAYQELENETFDFGEGPMQMEGTENIYYKMDLNMITLLKENNDYLNKSLSVSQLTPDSKEKRNLNLYNKYKKKKHLEKLKNYGWWIVSDKETHYARLYRGERSKYIKKMSNKKVRKSKDILQGSDYKKKYNFWYQLY